MRVLLGLVKKVVRQVEDLSLFFLFSFLQKSEKKYKKVFSFLMKTGSEYYIVSIRLCHVLTLFTGLVISFDAHRAFALRKDSVLRKPASPRGARNCEARPRVGSFQSDFGGRTNYLCKQ